MHSLFWDTAVTPTSLRWRSTLFRTNCKAAWGSRHWYPTAQWHEGLTCSHGKVHLKQLSQGLSSQLALFVLPCFRRSPSEPSSPGHRLTSGKLRILPGMFHKLNSRGWNRKQRDNKSKAQKEGSLFLSFTQQLPWAEASSPAPPSHFLTFCDYLTP